jgi:hypothetical protein
VAIPHVVCGAYESVQQEVIEREKHDKSEKEQC